VVHNQFPDRLIAARSGSPLVVGKGIGENFIASDVLALKPVTDKFIYLEEGDLIELSSDDISIWNLEDESVIRSSVQVKLGPDSMDKGDYRHYMQKEIFEQPKVILDTLEGRIGDEGVLIESFGVGAESIFKSVEEITLVACGTSYYAASVARYWIEELAKIPCQVEIASEFRYRPVACRPNSLFVSISQSGETADTLAALRLAKEIGFSSTLTICNVATSSIVRESDMALMINAGVEVGVASTKAFTAQLIDLMLLTIAIARYKGMSGGRETDIVKDLTRLSSVVEAILALDATVKSMANHFIDRDHALFLGRGSMFPIAMEGALKLKEISYIHAEGYAAGELKHGPLALVDEEVPVVAVAPNDELLEKLQSNLHEVKARGSHLYVFAAEDADFNEETGMTVIRLPKVSSLLAPIVYVIPLQLLAYHVAVGKGTDVDQPRNLAKSVTVE
jgi:glucosamine--fructose-6-phosphate aminotransferase (isomerizing)